MQSKPKKIQKRTKHAGPCSKIRSLKEEINEQCGWIENAGGEVLDIKLTSTAESIAKGDGYGVVRGEVRHSALIFYQYEVENAT